MENLTYSLMTFIWGGSLVSIAKWIDENPKKWKQGNKHGNLISIEDHNGYRKILPPSVLATKRRKRELQARLGIKGLRIELEDRPVSPNLYNLL